VSVAALVVSIVGAAVGATSLVIALRSLRAADKSAEAATVSAKAATDSARTAKAALQIERDRQHNEMGPILQGRIVSGPDYGGGRDHCLEVRLKGPVPLISIMVIVPTDAAVQGGMGLTSFNLVAQGDIRVGHPVRFLPPVTLSDNAHGHVTAFAQCRGEGGTFWPGVEVRVSLNGTWED
jgi:hypothetical protein